MNLPNPPGSPSLPRRPTGTSGATAELHAWHELRRQMEELHAQLHYLKLLLKLGVKAW